MSEAPYSGCSAMNWGSSSGWIQMLRGGLERVSTQKGWLDLVVRQWIRMGEVHIDVRLVGKGCSADEDIRWIVFSYPTRR